MSNPNRSDFRKSVRITYATLFMRLALGVSFLSAVGDRFGLWGAYGGPHVAWGNFSRFAAYTGTLLQFLPQAVYPLLAWAATAAETVFGLALILGLFTRAAAFLSAILLLTFALAMTFSLGIKAPLDYSVFSASAGGFLLAAFDQYPWSLDRVRQLRRKTKQQGGMNEMQAK